VSKTIVSKKTTFTHFTKGGVSAQTKGDVTDCILSKAVNLGLSGAYCSVKNIILQIEIKHNDPYSLLKY